MPGVSIRCPNRPRNSRHDGNPTTDPVRGARPRPDAAVAVLDPVHHPDPAASGERAGPGRRVGYHDRCARCHRAGRTRRAPGSGGPSTPGTPGATADTTAEAPAPTELGGTVIVETDLIRVELSTIGGDIRKVELLDYPVDVDHPEVPLSLMSSQSPNIFMTETGLLGRGHEFPNHRTEWRIDGDRFTLDPGQDSLEITFSHEAGPVTYRKVYRFHRDSYLVDVEYRVDNGSETPRSGYQYAQFVRSDYEEARPMGFLTALPSFRGGAIYTPEDRFQKIGFSDLVDSDLKRQTESGWVSMLQHYFVGAWLPADPGPYEFYSSVADRAAALPMYRIGYKTWRLWKSRPARPAYSTTACTSAPRNRTASRRRPRAWCCRSTTAGSPSSPRRCSGC
ncbi:MAG: membrane protein insertase YidC [Gammaproteobacteria bacterium]|nr:membrane protein insertase YidC [Gammaproteobacteria bacterium]